MSQYKSSARYKYRSRCCRGGLRGGGEAVGGGTRIELGRDVCCVERRMCINLSDCCKSVGGVWRRFSHSAARTTDSSVSSRVPDLDADADKGQPKTVERKSEMCHCAKTVTQ